MTATCEHGQLGRVCLMCEMRDGHAEFVRRVWGAAVGIRHADECPGVYTGSPECECDLGKIVKLCDAEAKP